MSKTFTVKGKKTGKCLFIICPGVLVQIKSSISVFCVKAGDTVSDQTPVHWLGCDLSMTLDFVKAHRWGEPSLVTCSYSLQVTRIRIARRGKYGN